MYDNSNNTKKRLTLWLDPQVIKTAKSLAAQQGIAVAKMVTGMIMGVAGMQQVKEENK